MDACGLTVDVMSDEHTSHTYLTPPSVPRDAVFFLMRPMTRAHSVGRVREAVMERLALPRRARRLEQRLKRGCVGFNRFARRKQRGMSLGRWMAGAQCRI